MAPLHEALRRDLERRVVEAREVAERGAAAALARLAVVDREPHGHLSTDDRVLRNRLRARARALGDKLRSSGAQEIERLTEEVAYEYWHRMLFARFLAENGLLVHPEHGVSVTLAECEELATEERAEDKWVLASRYAARMLPQIFRPDDPSLQVPFAPEHRVSLERLLEALAPEVFRADDSLGWVYQFWQAKRKDEVNAAGEPITGETLPAVTQLFTEPYMVSFILENTIGAWWSARHRGEPLPVEMPYLRRLEDGTPAAGGFEGWPTEWSEVTMLDPCCGSGHFLVAALRLLVPLRIHDEGLSAAEAVDAVLRENLYGLELDPRCTQIAAFALALAAWTTPGAEGYRPLAELQIACSGLAVGAKKEQWLALAEGDQRLEAALGRLYDLFKLAPELGSLIDPTVDGEDLLTASFQAVQPLLARALQSERVKTDEQLEATAVLAQGIARAAELLARKYVLVATNVPYLARGKQDRVLRDFCDSFYPHSKFDLATVFVERSLRAARESGTVALVAPQNWLFLPTYKNVRRALLQHYAWTWFIRLGSRAFAEIGGEVVNVGLFALCNAAPRATSAAFTIDTTDRKDSQAKAGALVSASLTGFAQSAQLANPDFTILSGDSPATLLGAYVSSRQGISPADLSRYGRNFWEIPGRSPEWHPWQTTVERTIDFGGREWVLWWNASLMAAVAAGAAFIRGEDAWGKLGVAASQMGGLGATLYSGDKFDTNVTVLLPKEPSHLPAIWAYCQSPEFSRELRKIDHSVKITNSSFLKVPFDVEYWTQVAQRQYPNGLPEPHSDDPTQWLFRGEIAPSTAPLQVAVTNLLGYRWPDQAEDAKLNAFTDADGIVCLPAVRGELPAAERLSALLAAAYGTDWSPTKRDELLAQVGFGGKSVEQWLQDGFFEQHCTLFRHRPFIWHITDKAKGGFSALVNYHKLDRKMLETLTYTYLGDWISRQEEARRRDERGADVRLAAAKELQEKLRLILEGEPPFDIFVRWKPLHEQLIGWEPDLNDGVRVNIWPFVQTGVLRSRVNVNWKKDRGKNPPGSPWGPERYNRYEDIPREDRPAELRDVDSLTNEIKRRARERAAASIEAKHVEQPRKRARR